MEKRLVSAYDKMIMPESCSRRIEEALERKRKPERGRYTAVLSPAEGRKAWRSSLAGVCLAVLLMAGGAALFVKTQGRLRDSGLDAPASPTATMETAAQEQWGAVAVPYGAEAEAFLMDMCRYMPDWSGESTLDDSFWRDFLYNSFAEYEKGEGMMVETIVGQVPRLGGTVMVSREQAKSYAMLAMGVELPEFKTEGLGEGLSYADGYYRVTPRENTVKLENMELEISRERCDDYVEGRSWEYCTAVYRISAARGGRAVAASYVSFYLKKTENQNGFVILAKTTNQDMYSYENEEIEAVARKFWDAWYAGDRETMRELMTSRSDWNLEAIGSGGTGGYQYAVSDVRIYRGPLETLGGNPVAIVRYRFLPPGETVYIDSPWTLCLEMEETTDGWKVRYYADKQISAVLSDPENLWDAADKFAEAYLAGDKEGVRALMREKDAGDVPVYDGNPVDAFGRSVSIVDVRPGTEPEAEVRITYWVSVDDSADAKEAQQEGSEQVVVVTMVRLEEGWVVDSCLSGRGELGTNQDDGGEKLEK